MSDEAHPAALAPNWRTVLVIDALLGVAVFAFGVALMRWWSVPGGAFVGASGLSYIVLVARRHRQWRDQRRTAGL